MKEIKKTVIRIEVDQSKQKGVTVNGILRVATYCRVSTERGRAIKKLSKSKGILQ